MKRSPVSPPRALKRAAPDAEIRPYSKFPFIYQAETSDLNLAFQVGFLIANTYC